MARWQTGIPSLIAAVLLTACGTAPPPGTGMAIQQLTGNLQRGPTYWNGDMAPNPANVRPFRRYPWQQPGGPDVPQGSQMPQQVPPGSQLPQQVPPAQPQGPVIPPPSRVPQQYPPAQPGTLGGPALDACIQNYMNGVNFIMAPTEQQLAALRESARQHCLSQVQNPGPGIPF